VGSEEIVTPKVIEAYLTREKEGFEKLDPQTWISIYRGETNSFRVLTHLAKEWLLLTIYPYVTAPQGKENRLALYSHLLELNHEMNLAKFCLDEDGEVVLSVEFPTENLDDSEFRDGFQILSYYADKYYLDILNLAQERQIK
jgi:hypothetical protein